MCATVCWACVSSAVWVQSPLLFSDSFWLRWERRPLSNEKRVLRLLCKVSQAARTLLESEPANESAVKIRHEGCITQRWCHCLIPLEVIIINSSLINPSPSCYPLESYYSSLNHLIPYWLSVFQLLEWNIAFHACRKTVYCVFFLKFSPLYWIIFFNFSVATWPWLCNGCPFCHFCRQ